MIERWGQDCQTLLSTGGHEKLLLFTQCLTDEIEIILTDLTVKYLPGQSCHCCSPSSSSVSASLVSQCSTWLSSEVTALLVNTSPRGQAEVSPADPAPASPTSSTTGGDWPRTRRTSWWKMSSPMMKFRILQQILNPDQRWLINVECSDVMILI